MPSVMTEPTPTGVWRDAACTRRFTKLRISITEACNFRCAYCVGEPGACRDADVAILGAKEIIDICTNVCACGIREIRLTGGEPTLHPALGEIVDGLSALPLRKLGMTSNGLLLPPLLPALAASRCRYLNISLDSLDARTFRRITGSSAFERVREAIVSAAALGFTVKVNMVVMRGINDKEIFDYVDFAARYGVEVRFLELMRIGPLAESFTRRFVAAADVLARIRTRYMVYARPQAADATSVGYRTDSGAAIGVIAAESAPFCSHCSRLRLTARGMLRSCLMDDEEVSIRGVAPQCYAAVLQALARTKPRITAHRPRRSMQTIGG